MCVCVCVCVNVKVCVCVVRVSVCQSVCMCLFNCNGLRVCMLFLYIYSSVSQPCFHSRHPSLLKELLTEPLAIIYWYMNIKFRNSRQPLSFIGHPSWEPLIYSVWVWVCVCANASAVNSNEVLRCSKDIL